MMRDGYGTIAMTRAGAGLRDARKPVEAMMDPVTKAGELLRGHQAEARERLEGAVESTRNRLETNVQSHPLRTVLLSVGAGLLVGLILGIGRRRGSD
jgi:ElaB/YqjD/DUF883 family membrane-anchored ribosome-binding protein